LQREALKIRITEPITGPRPDTHTCSLRSVRPRPYLYEHMFPSSRTSALAQRALDALRLTRSFLLLEDDHDVDWEVDTDEPTQAAHPHRAPLRGHPRERRPGRQAPATQHCLSPVQRTAPRARATQRSPGASHPR